MWNKKRSLETHDQLLQRFDGAVEAEEAGPAFSSGADDWVLDPIVLNRGSVHSDIWRGSAADLANRDSVGGFSGQRLVEGKPGLQRRDRSARYALIASIRVPEAEIDLYTAIANGIGIATPAS